MPLNLSDSGFSESSSGGGALVMVDEELDGKGGMDCDWIGRSQELSWWPSSSPCEGLLGLLLLRAVGDELPSLDLIGLSGCDSDKCVGRGRLLGSIVKPAKKIRK